MVKGYYAREAGAVLNKKNKTGIRQAIGLLVTLLRDAGIDLGDGEQSADNADKKPEASKKDAKESANALNASGTNAARNRAIIEAAGFSMQDVYTLLDTAIRASVGENASYEMIPQIADVFDDYFVYREGWRGPFYRVPYTIDENGGVMLDTPILVVRKVQYVQPGGALDVAEAAVTLETDTVDLIERAIAADGTARIKIIAPGIGSSGYYSADVLRDAAKRKVFAAGTQMFWDHATASEERERPEGSLDRLAAVLKTDAEYVESDPRGAGLYARAEIRSRFRDDVDELAPHIGTSIRAAGKAKIGEINGRRMPIITSIDEAKSVDFVTRAGAGGAIVQMFEAAGRKPDEPGASEDHSRTAIIEADRGASNEGETEMPLTDADRAAIAEMIASGIKTGLAEAVAPLRAQIDAARDAADLRDAEAAVTRYLATIEGLPRATRERLAPEIARNFKRTDSGAVDIAALTESARQRAIDEIRYLRESGARVSMPKGFGDSAPLREGDNGADNGGAGGDDTADDLAGIFASWGMSEAASKTAARGRV